MPDCIARIFEPLLRLLLRSEGRHRFPESASYVRTSSPSSRGQEVRRQRGRRRELWLALHGVDIGPRLIHGVDVMA